MVLRLRLLRQLSASRPRFTELRAWVCKSRNLLRVGRDFLCPGLPTNKPPRPANLYLQSESIQTSTPCSGRTQPSHLSSALIAEALSANPKKLGSLSEAETKARD